MIYNPEKHETWPEECQDVIVWSPIEGRTLATFYHHDNRKNEYPHFGNWFNREGDSEDAHESPVRNPCEWWPLPELECMKLEKLK